jgi:hypothetical protein
MKPPKCSPLTLISTPRLACCRRVSRIACVGRPNTWMCTVAVKRSRVGLLRALADDFQMRFDRLGVGVNLHDRYLVFGLVYVLVERDESWLVGLDELDEARHPVALKVEAPRLQGLVAMKMNGEGNDRSLSRLDGRPPGGGP